MLRGIAIAVLVIGIAGTAYWGYQEHREKTAVLINAENNYQRAFHDLSYQMDLLNDKIGTTLAMNSRSSLSPQLAEVWKITSQAHSDVGQLPLTLLPFNKTEEFLASVGNFSYKAAIRDLDKEPLTEKEYSTLKALYEQSGEIQQDLRKVQHMVLENNLRWMDVELALATEKGQADNTIIDGFKTVEKTVESYSETEFGPAQINLQKKDENFKKLPGEKITKEKAIQITRKYTPLRKGGKVKVTENGKGSDYGFFSVSIQNPKTKLEANMDITKKGGYPIWFLLDRDVKNQKLSLNDASNKAISFLKEHNFENLDLFESAQYDNIGVFTFVGTQDDVRIYPDAIDMKVALDNGDVIGFSAEEYLKSHKAREIPQAAIELADAKKKVNPNLKVMDEKKAIIMNDLNEEVLCYEFTGVLGNDTFRIYINAEDGTEEKVEKLHNAEPVYEDVV
ncbi:MULTISPECIES: germination protein YpeB [Mesobacillus]|uniref:Germination protein YpeB n=1 Tax=Mesobacillus selenatarsenatis TaxID=388741 RepID=A0A846TLG3_9BACI|nr:MULTISPECIES: germination protein YpeB [Mesobacillus]NKE04905.1 germination protein YpeB [Mesobacillus selenatarsenatis]